MNDTRDKKMIAIIDNFSVIYILGGVSWILFRGEQKKQKTD